MSKINELERKYSESVKGGEKALEIILDFIDEFQDSWVSEEDEAYKYAVSRQRKFYKGMHKTALIWHYGIRRIPGLNRLVCGLCGKKFPKEAFKNGPWFFPYKQKLIERVNKMKGHRRDYEWLFNRLEDDKSREVMMNAMMIDITCECKYAVEINDIKKCPQYFDPSIVKVGKDEVFVDMGAFIGDTELIYIDFIRSNGGSIKAIYGYEPDENTYAKAVENMKPYDFANIKNVGVGSKSEEVCFETQIGGRSTVVTSKDGSNVETARLVAIDEDIKEKVTFIKMDLEGYEAEALKGSKNHIINDTPQLAVCVYHKIEDLYALPQLIESYNTNYKMYMRHYDDQQAETVLYCIP
jgi:FkbM family methyltransferase